MLCHMLSTNVCLTSSPLLTVFTKNWVHIRFVCKLENSSYFLLMVLVVFHLCLGYFIVHLASLQVLFFLITLSFACYQYFFLGSDIKNLKVSLTWSRDQDKKWRMSFEVSFQWKVIFYSDSHGNRQAARGFDIVESNICLMNQQNGDVCF